MLSFPLVHVPWSLSTPDGIPTKREYSGSVIEYLTRVLPVKTTSLNRNIQEEADTCTMFILHCLNTRTPLPNASTTIVTSNVTRHRCISAACTILQGYTLECFVQHWCRQKRRLLVINNICQNMGEEICSHTLLYRL